MPGRSWLDPIIAAIRRRRKPIAIARVTTFHIYIQTIWRFTSEEQLHGIGQIPHPRQLPGSSVILRQWATHLWVRVSTRIFHLLGSSFQLEIRSCNGLFQKFLPSELLPYPAPSSMPLWWQSRRTLYPTNIVAWFRVLRRFSGTGNLRVGRALRAARSCMASR